MTRRIRTSDLQLQLVSSLAVDHRSPNLDLLTVRVAPDQQVGGTTRPTIVPCGWIFKSSQVVDSADFWNPTGPQPT
jgi:hypothetical protein